VLLQVETALDGNWQEAVCWLMEVTVVGATRATVLVRTYNER
jgi:hypothetical protein